MENHGFGDLAGFISNYFGEQIFVDGEWKSVIESVSSEELIAYAELHLNNSNLEITEKIILAGLIDDEIRRVRLVRNLMKNVFFATK